MNRGGPEGMLPRVALSFSSSSLITDWIRSDEWWRGVRGGGGVDRTCSQSCPSLQNARKTRGCCVRAAAVCERRAAEEEGKVDALGQRRRVGGAGGWTESEEQQSSSKKDYRRCCCWLWLKMYVPLFTCSEDGPAGELNCSKLVDSNNIHDIL